MFPWCFTDRKIKLEPYGTEHVCCVCQVRGWLYMELGPAQATHMHLTRRCGCGGTIELSRGRKPHRQYGFETTQQLPVDSWGCPCYRWRMECVIVLGSTSRCFSWPKLFLTKGGFLSLPLKNHSLWFSTVKILLNESKMQGTNAGSDFSTHNSSANREGTVLVLWSWGSSTGKSFEISRLAYRNS